MSGLKRGISPTPRGPFLFLSIGLEEERPAIWAIASSYADGKRLETWLATEAVQQRLRAALDEALAELDSEST